MSYDNLSSVSQNVLKFYQQLTGEERRIHFIFDDFHFCHSRVIGLDMMENRIFTLCYMITWVVFLRMFWNFISSLPVKRGGSLSFLVGTISNVLVMEIGWTDMGSGGYILVSCVHSNTSFIWNEASLWNADIVWYNWKPCGLWRYRPRVASRRGHCENAPFVWKYITFNKWRAHWAQYFFSLCTALFCTQLFFVHKSS
jgi:hypothetical protein